MADPVVASDGHSYERDAIQSVLSNGNGLSPLTREVLEKSVFPNVNLRKRMRDHDDELLQAAEVAAGVGAATARAEFSGAAGSSAAVGSSLADPVVLELDFAAVKSEEPEAKRSRSSSSIDRS